MRREGSLKVSECACVRSCDSSVQVILNARLVYRMPHDSFGERAGAGRQCVTRVSLLNILIVRLIVPDDSGKVSAVRAFVCALALVVRVIALVRARA
jgi:hypothetical protein